MLLDAPEYSHCTRSIILNNKKSSRKILGSGRPISLFPYRPIPIITDISDFHIGRYRCRYRYRNCHIGRYRCRYRYGNATYSKCNKMQFFGKKVIFFSIFLIFLVQIFISLFQVYILGDFNEFLYKIEPNFKHRNPYSIPIVYSRYEL